MKVSNRMLFAFMLVAVPGSAVVGRQSSMPDWLEVYWYVFGVLVGVFTLGLVTAALLAEDEDEPEPPVADAEEAKWRRLLEHKDSEVR